MYFGFLDYVKRELKAIPGVTFVNLVSHPGVLEIIVGGGCEVRIAQVLSYNIPTSVGTIGDIEVPLVDGFWGKNIRFSRPESNDDGILLLL